MSPLTAILRPASVPPGMQLIFQGPAVTPNFAAMAFDLLAGYNKIKNVCFWGGHVGDQGLLALADLLQVRCCPAYIYASRGARCS